MVSSPYRLRAPSLVVAAFALAATPACLDGDDPAEEPNLAEAQLSACDFGASTPGLDVSTYQGSVDWNAVAGAGWRYAITRINHQGNPVDETFAVNWAGIKAAGMVRGAYQYMAPLEDQAANAQLVIELVGVLGAGDLPVTLDVEKPNPGVDQATYQAKILEWVELVEAGTGKRPMIYTGYYYWNDFVGTDAFADSPLWIANYNDGPNDGCPPVPGGWTDWTFWQHNSNPIGPDVPGMPQATAVDRNFFRGSEEDLLAFAGGGTYAATKLEVRAPSSVLVGETFDVSVRYENSGAQPWDDATLLGTTEPRDRPSPFADASWLSDHRVASAPGVNPGEEHTFTFTMTAPSAPGAYVEHFGLVQEAVTWFADAGGPPDDAIRIALQVVDGEGGGEGGAGGTDAGEGGSLDGAQVGSGLPVVGAGGAGGGDDASVDDGGCSIGAVAPRRRSGAVAGFAALALALGARRRRLC